MTASITSLVVGLRCGDPKAQRQLYRRFLTPLHRRAVRILRNSGDGYDVAAGLLVDFLDIYCHQFKGTNEASLMGYLKVAVVRRSMALRDRRENLTELSETLTAHSESRDLLVLERLEQCLAQLPPRSRQLLRLKYAADYDNITIGQLLGVSRAAVSQQLTNPVKGALARLRRCINRLSHHTTGARS